MRLFIFLFLVILQPFCESFLLGKESTKTIEEIRNEESASFYKIGLELAKFYELPPEIEIQDITEKLLESPYVRVNQKQNILNYNRRIFVFTYPSDGLKIKGFISFVPDPENHPIIVYLRGGNRIFGIPNPGARMFCGNNYTIIATMYRGGVSEGVDEFGGDDVNDVKNLIDFIPALENKLGVNFQNQKMFLLGESRGGMQMFLSLARFPELQTRFTKIVSLSGRLDMRNCLETRPDMVEMFTEDFGLVTGVNEEEWIKKRDPLSVANSISPKLPILIIQGTEDNRVSLDDGYNMVSKLQSNGNNVVYWEIEGGDHCLGNIKDITQLIFNWLEE